jgi:hypothetical protein
VARIRVGDIEIDGDRVRIGGQEMGAPRPVAPPPAADAPPFPFPGSPRALGIAGAVVALAGLGLTLRPGAPPGIAGFVLGGGALIPFGVGLLVLAVLKRRALAQQAAQLRIAAERRLEPVLAQVRQALAGEGRDHTFEWIVARTRALEADVARALGLLRDRRQVLEELDTDTGDFYYVLAAPEPPAGGSLDDRLRALEKR